jgi:Baseplate J-like protein
MTSFDYTRRDYDTIKSDLLARASKVFPEWTDRDPSDFGMLLVDLWSYAADVLHFYIDRSAGEAFLPTASQRESVLAFANLLDYIPGSRSSAKGTVTLQNTTASPVAIPAGTEFIARYNNKTYQVYSLASASVPASSALEIDLAEGTKVENESLTTSSTGESGQRFSLARTNVVPSSILVQVFEDPDQPTNYTFVQRLTDADTGERVYTTTVNADNELQVVFGTALNGFTPPTGSAISVSYVYSSGAEGNLPAGSVVAFKSVAPTGITITGSSAFSGGENEESIESMKTSIPAAISTQNRAVTGQDFVALALQVEGVAKAAVEYTPGGGSASAGFTNASVTMYPQPTRSDFLTTLDTSQTVSADLEERVLVALQPRALLGVDVVVAPSITWQPIDMAITVYVNERFVTNWVKADVATAIDELFSFDNVFFGQRLTLGQLYRIVLNVAGVDYCTVQVFDLAGNTGLQQSILIDPLELPKRGAVGLTMVGGVSTS